MDSNCMEVGGDGTEILSPCRSLVCMFILIVHVEMVFH